MLTIQNLHVSANGSEILKGIQLTVKPGEVHAIMGPNGSGKTTLSHVLSGRPGYSVTAGEVMYQHQNLLAMSPEERAIVGVFLAMQYPVELPGVNNLYFLKIAMNSLRKARGQDSLDAVDFMDLVKSYLSDVGLDEKFLKRSVNAGFSGGEKKRNEILQMLLLQPTLAILDETDSGLDVDALQIVSNGVKKLRDPNRAIIVITHYQRLLNFIEPDYVHVLVDGKIVKSGDKTLAQQIERSGYAILS